MVADVAVGVAAIADDHDQEEARHGTDLSEHQHHVFFQQVVVGG